MEEYEALDLALRNGFLYVTTLGIVALSAYNKFKAIFNRGKTRRELGYAESQDSDSIVDWKHELIPFFVAILLVYSFYPVSFFTYMPFMPNHWMLDILYTALIISSTSNAEYAGVQKLGNIVSSMIGRVAKRF